MLITGLILFCKAKPHSRSVGNIPLQMCSAITESPFKLDKTLKILDSTQQDISKHRRLQALCANAPLLSHPCPGAQTQLEDEEEAWEWTEESEEKSTWHCKGNGQGKRSGTVRSCKDSHVPAGTPPLPGAPRSSSLQHRWVCSHTNPTAEGSLLCFNG